MAGTALLLPEIVLLFGALWALFADRLPGRDVGAAWAGAVATLAAAVIAAVQPVGVLAFGGQLAFTEPTRFARVAVALLLFVWCIWIAGRGAGRDRRREAVALALFSAMGTLLVCAAAELVTLFVALELATIPAYVLVGYDARDARSLEGALKYFLLSILTTLVMLYGFSFLYGLTGTTLIARMDLSNAGIVGLIAAVLAVTGLLAKLSAAPFHYWAPDAYSGAGPWAVAYTSTVPKIGGAVALVRIVLAIGVSVQQLSFVLALAAVASVLIGNLAALPQTDIRRLMAYSGVGHAGYILLGVAAMSAAGGTAAIFYSVAYAIPAMAIMLLAAENGVTIAEWGQLSTRRAASAWASVLFLLSLIGIPPLVGFFGKLYLFASALQRGLTVAVVIAVIMSVVSAAYYLKLVRSSFFGDAAPGNATVEPSTPASIAIGLLAFAVFAMGLLAGPLLAWAGSVTP